MFKWNAGDYSRSSSEQEKWATELIAKLKLRGDERILDIGCGDGKVTAAIARLLTEGSVLGIDSSPEMIFFACQTRGCDTNKNLSFLKIDARELDFQPEFDVVFSNAALHWTTEHLKVLQGIKKCLRPFGKVLLQMGGRGNTEAMLTVVSTIMGKSKWSEYFTNFSFKYGFYGPEEYLAWLEMAGLNAIRVELIPKDMVHGGEEGLAAWFRTTWLPYIQAVPQHLQEEFIYEAVKTYIGKYPLDTQGRAHVQMMRLEVEAQNIQ
ncbi:Methyltransferase type 11 [Desulfofarcimen acetoxidans DSM 771]|jgi:trans-aconitate methyltransferase|uniref:Methyltransferase type 11 n=1 Tax=Desulfofarcimen acetoxidans (strain ATCC 49208 / DSM 771 / KCTC 5769 / VKM B-1644 / 5575) TaxID=485916 RepID=C8VYG6_DESAS|nr:methyltransferase domain-containing protein [Desulfofarcimen acetoxidans]ACV62847.1 Methyltransferase type 11 [Desulfofarcimen acetoxidans DSM 771]